MQPLKDMNLKPFRIFLKIGILNCLLLFGKLFIAILFFSVMNTLRCDIIDSKNIVFFVSYSFQCFLGQNLILFLIFSTLDLPEILAVCLS